MDYRVRHHPKTKSELESRSVILRNLMEGTATDSDKQTMLDLIDNENILVEQEYATDKWRARRRRKLLEYFEQGQTNSSAWIVKTPRTYLLLEEWASWYPNVKYIMMIRNGLDMAFSSKSAMVRGSRLACHFGRDISELASNPETLPIAALEFWNRANRWAKRVGSEVLGDRFISVSYDELLSNPQPQVERILEFLGCNSAENVEKASQFIDPSKSTANRYLKHDLSIFAPSQLEQVRELGFKFRVE